ncbi:Glycerate kinase [Bacillus manliponensis]
MKIREFGKRSGLSIDTIRHYMDLGLIVPEKKGGHYFFDERCQKDLELILQFKGMGFQLNEIKMIFLYERFSQLTNYEKSEYYQSLFMNKYKKIEQEIKNLKALDLLKCLQCGEKPLLQDGMIHRNQITEGKLVCHCGEEYSVQAGILIVDKPFQSNMKFLLEEYIVETDLSYLENIHITAEWSKRKLVQLDLNHKVLIELGSGSGFFLRNVYEELPENCLYIAVDHNLERHQFLKSVLERSGVKRNVLFICADFLHIPLQDATVDIVMDQAGTSNYSFENEGFLLQKLISLFKQDSYLLGSFIAFEKFSSKSKIELLYRDNFLSGKIKKNLNELGYAVLDEKTSKPSDKGGGNMKISLCKAKRYILICFSVKDRVNPIFFYFPFKI